MATHHLQFQVQQKIIESAYRSLLSSQYCVAWDARLHWHPMFSCSTHMLSDSSLCFNSIRGKNHNAEPLKLEVYAELRIIKYG
ncbi:unnamed protein product [Sphagnum jensenii]|uniref:Uncharacterized protein n=1 Tax=Sphagnum jensenii TaxID=128206 RepID=A0ABP1BD79_9BRYO